MKKRYGFLLVLAGIVLAAPFIRDNVLRSLFVTIGLAATALPFGMINWGIINWRKRRAD